MKTPLNTKSCRLAVTGKTSGLSLYHLLLFGWVRVAGSSEIAVRSFSAVAGIASVAVLFLLARRLAGVRVALWAGLLMAVNPLYVRYAQEARATGK